MKNLIKLLAVIGPLIAFTAWAATLTAPLNTKTAVSCATTITTAIPQSTPAANDTSGQPNRLCASFQNLAASTAVFVGDCTNITTTNGVDLPAASAPWTYCGSSAICCVAATGTVSLGVTETTKQ